MFWSGRNILWWALYVPPIVGAITHGWRPGSSVSPRAATGIAVVLGALVLLGTGRVLITRPVNALLNKAPPRITEAVRQQTQGGARVFAGWWGSWFELTLPDVPMFVDARAEVFPDAVWHDYFLATDAGLAGNASSIDGASTSSPFPGGPVRRSSPRWRPIRTVGRLQDADSVVSFAEP